jgi:hypothetical protein
MTRRRGSNVISWDRRDDHIICLFTKDQIDWIRDNSGNYCSAVDTILDGNQAHAGAHRLRKLRSVVEKLLEDLPWNDTVVVFRNEAHRLAWVWLLEELLGIYGTGGVEPGTRWLCHLIDFLRTAGRRQVADGSGPQ